MPFVNVALLEDNYFLGVEEAFALPLSSLYFSVSVSYLQLVHKLKIHSFSTGPVRDFNARDVLDVYSTVRRHRPYCRYSAGLLSV
jgi:hypothetical protein